MKINQEFVVPQPVPVVWSFFKDVQTVASCLPGADLTGRREDGALLGKVSAKLGPFQASFEGEGKVDYQDEAKTIAFDGKGVDRKGASRGRMTMSCRLLDEGPATRVAVEADVQLAGPIAQFGRTSLITEVANQLVAEFVRRAEAHLATVTAAAEAGPTAQAAPASAAEAPTADVAAPVGASPASRPAPATPAAPPKEVDVFGLVWTAFKAWIRSRFSSGVKT